MSWYTTDWIRLVWYRDGHATKSSKRKIVGKQLDVLDTRPNTGKIYEDTLYKKALFYSRNLNTITSDRKKIKFICVYQMPEVLEVKQKNYDNTDIKITHNIKWKVSLVEENER